MDALPTFDGDAMMRALDAKRDEHELSWPEMADTLYRQSEELNARLQDDAMCSGALVRTVKRGTMSCQYALIVLRWLGRAPEDFLTGSIVDVGETRLPRAGADQRLRFDLAQLHEALDEHRRGRSLTWRALADEIGCTPSRLTNLRKASLADMDLTMRVTQRIARPAAAFVRAVDA